MCIRRLLLLLDFRLCMYYMYVGLLFFFFFALGMLQTNKKQCWCTFLLSITGTGTYFFVCGVVAVKVVRASVHVHVRFIL